ncbi:MAG: hypothetical protein M3Y87_13820 [Myxococcota bacterium]|nr:hypothetical protein [Myxococcota bacterium]
MQTARTSRPSFPQARPSDPGRGTGERARLHFAGVRTPIVTTVARRREDGLVVVQELPFLRLHSEVHDEQRRRARIARVAVDVQGDVPRLVLELSYDDDGSGVDGGGVDGGGALEVDVDLDDLRARDATLGYGEPRPDPGPRASERARRVRSDQDTLLFATEPAGASIEPARESRPSMPPHLARRGSDLELALRALWARFRAATDALTHGLDQAMTALRTDP